MTAYDYLESAGEEPKEDDLELISDATIMLAALGRLRTFCRERGVSSQEEFVSAVDAEYDKLAASAGDGEILTREAFHEVCSDIWKDAAR